MCLESIGCRLRLLELELVLLAALYWRMRTSYPTEARAVRPETWKIVGGMIAEDLGAAGPIDCHVGIRISWLSKQARCRRSCRWRSK